MDEGVGAVRTVPLRRIARILNGGTPTSAENNWGGDIEWATPVDLARTDGRVLGPTDRKLTEIGLATGITLAPHNAILLSTRAPIGYTSILATQTSFNQGCKAIVLSSPGDPRFLQFSLISQKESLQAAGSGSTFLELSNEALAEAPVFLFPVEEQRRIADFLDDRVARIDQIIAARQQQVRHADRARISLVDSVLTPAHPSGMTRLGRLATIQSGLTVDEKRSNASGGDCYPYLRVANVQAGGLDLAEIKTVVAEEALAKRCTLRPGDVLMTEGGDLDKLGRGTVWHGEISPCLHQNHVFAVRPARELLVADYLALYTQSSAARSYFERTGSKTTNLASTSASKVMALPIPFVPISEQRDLASECQNQLAAVDAGVTALISAVSLLQEYKQSLITAAVTGEFDVTTASTKIPE
ncbi:MAG: restriction endonuclease subunit S [Cutibacterium granulosum]|uniref:restriction endonuclease subunit S n=1 Tax=Cutibacterium granulosum TaxID=33011 RepID=UPI002906432C|nr:restriction endonuclease subunit S [Cutibacterium granulosum]MDU3822217.1 restriction endonuclease subunit S [Cutibacterium granulosum]